MAHKTENTTLGKNSKPKRKLQMEQVMNLKTLPTQLLNEEWSNDDIIVYLSSQYPSYLYSPIYDSKVLEYVNLPSGNHPFIDTNTLAWHNKALVHQNLDRVGKPIRLAGWVYNSASELMMEFLHPNRNQEPELNSFRQKFLCWRTIARLIDLGIGQEKKKLETINDLVIEYSIKKIKELNKKDDYMIFPGYWMNRSQKKLKTLHGIGYKFEYQSKGFFIFSIYNTGWGSDYHYTYKQTCPDLKVKKSSRYIVQNVSFQGVMKILKHVYQLSLGLKLLDRGPSRFYRWALCHGENYLDNVEDFLLYDDLITEQNSGTCTWKCIKAIFRDHLKSKDVYKRVTFRMKIQTINNYAIYLPTHHFTEASEFANNQELLTKAHKQCVRAADKFDDQQKVAVNCAELLELAFKAIPKSFS